MKLQLSPRMRDAEPVRHCGWPDCRAACCVYGAWVDENRAAEIVSKADLFQPFLAGKNHDPASWFTTELEPDPYVPSGRVRHTRVIEDPEHYGGTTCIFMQQDYRCALQSAGEAAGLHPWHFKPFYCILHPLDVDPEGRITLDETRLMVHEPGSCLRSAPDSSRLLELFSDEVRFLAGED